MSNRAHAERSSLPLHLLASTTLIALLSACGGGGGGGGSPSPPPAPDTTPPNTTISAPPAAASNSATATITFTSSEAGSAFESRVDGATFATATSPQTLTGLADGSHTFEVRARDAAGNTDATPASATWVVDTVAPDTQLDGSPAGTVTSATATFTFSSPDTTASFEASLDSGAFATATSPYALNAVADGAHTLRIRARDAAGNVDATPVSASWSVDATPPTASITFPLPVSYTQAATLTVRGAASDASGVAEVRVNGVLATSATSFATWTAVVPIAAGNNNLIVSTKDVPGNAAASAASAQVSNRGPTILLAAGIDYDPNGNRIVVIDQATRMVYGFAVGTGLGTQIANLRPLDLTDSTTLEEVIVDAASNRALVVEEVSDRIVAVNLATGAYEVVSPKAGAEVEMGYGCGLALDSANNRLFVSSPVNKTVFSVNLATGVRTVVSSPTVGSGSTTNYRPGGLVYDTLSNPGVPRLLVVNTDLTQPSVVAITVANGDRVTLSSSAPTGTGPGFSAPSAMTLDTVNHRVLVLDSLAHAVYSVDLSSGNRTVVTSASVGSGAALHEYGAITMNPATQRAFINQTGGEVLEIDLATGVRTTLVGTNVGTGPRLVGPRAPVIERSGGRPVSVLALDYEDRVIRVDLHNGNRTLVSSNIEGVGTGAGFITPFDMVLDTRAASGGSSALVLTSQTLHSVDLTNGMRTIITALNTTLPSVNQPRALVLDAAANRVLFIDNDNQLANADVLYAIDLATNNRTVVSSGSVGTSGANANFALPTDLVLEPAVNPTRALIINAPGSGQRGNILAVNLANGDRSEFIAGYNVGIGPAITLGVSLFLDTPNQRLLGINSYPTFVFGVPLHAPVRQMISGTFPGTEVVTGTGVTRFGSGLDVDTASGIAFTFSEDQSLMAIDLATGDRVLVSH